MSEANPQSHESQIRAAMEGEVVQARKATLEKKFKPEEVTEVLQQLFHAAIAHVQGDPKALPETLREISGDREKEDIFIFITTNKNSNIVTPLLLGTKFTAEQLTCLQDLLNSEKFEDNEAALDTINVVNDHEGSFDMVAQHIERGKLFGGKAIDVLIKMMKESEDKRKFLQVLNSIEKLLDKDENESVLDQNAIESIADFVGKLWEHCPNHPQFLRLVPHLARHLSEISSY